MTRTFYSSVATSFDSVELSFDWYIESGFDSGEYLAVDAWNGSTWIELDCLRGNVDSENTWHSESIVIDGSLANDDFKVRFRSLVSARSEDANVDNVKIIAQTGTANALANESVDQFFAAGAVAPADGDDDLLDNIVAMLF